MNFLTLILEAMLAALILINGKPLAAMRAFNVLPHPSISKNIQMEWKSMNKIKQIFKRWICSRCNTKNQPSREYCVYCRGPIYVFGRSKRMIRGVNA